MPQVIVDANSAVRVIRPKGIQVTIVNQSAVDVFMDREAMRLNATAPGIAPNGTKIAANGGQLQVEPWPGEMWFRAVSQTPIEVQP